MSLYVIFSMLKEIPWLSVLVFLHCYSHQQGVPWVALFLIPALDFPVIPNLSNFHLAPRHDSLHISTRLSLFRAYDCYNISILVHEYTHNKLPFLMEWFTSIAFLNHFLIIVMCNCTVAYFYTFKNVFLGEMESWITFIN